MGYGSKSIQDWVEDCHLLSRSKGWWDDCASNGAFVAMGAETPDRSGPLDPSKVVTTIPTKLCLIHSEASEALEDFREGKMERTGGRFVGSDQQVMTKPEGFPTELADIVIRCFDLAGALGINLEQEIRIKHAFNETRPQRHGGKKV